MEHSHVVIYFYFFSLAVSSDKNKLRFPPVWFNESLRVGIANVWVLGFESLHLHVGLNINSKFVSLQKCSQPQHLYVVFRAPVSVLTRHLRQWMRLLST